MNALNTCERDIQTIMHEAIKYMDFSVTEGKRSAETQHEYWQKGRELKNPNADPLKRDSWKLVDIDKKVTTKDGYEKLSRHQVGEKSGAIDVVPYPTMWSDEEKMHELAGVIKTVQQQLFEAGKIEKLLDWGYDLWKWDRPHWQFQT